MTPLKTRKYILSCERDGDEAIWAENVTPAQALSMARKAERLYLRLESLTERQYNHREGTPKWSEIQARINAITAEMQPFAEGVNVILRDPVTKASWMLTDGWEVYEAPGV